MTPVTPDEAVSFGQKVSDFFSGTIFRFDKVGENGTPMWIILAAILLLGVILFAVSRSKQRWTTRMLANAALCIALSFILSYIRLYKMPQGGSITCASMLPIFLFAYAYGTVPGFVTGMAYGMLQFIQDAYFVHPIQVLLDYPLAFAMLALAGAFKDKPWGLYVGIVLGSVGRMVCAVLSGVIFFAEYAGDMNPWVYSIGYNATYILPEAIICMVIAAIPAVRKTALRLAHNER